MRIIANNARVIIQFLFILVLYFSYAHIVTCKIELVRYNDNTIAEFIRQFTTFLSQHASSVKKKDLHADYLDIVNEQLAHQPYPGTTGDHSVEKPFQQQLSLNQLAQQSYLNYNRPFRPHSGPSPLPHKPLPPGILPIRPALPPGLQSEPFAYPQTSFVGALYSIARYDDLRCVPRMLCEVTSSSKENDASKKDNKSPLPFLSRDAIVTLLTVLNFVDDSPILLFTRAIALGYSSRGDPKTCLNAYPLCPKDTDLLVNYLNNHNGGFFQFFNHHQFLQQQPQYAPQYQQFLQTTNVQSDSGKIQSDLTNLDQLVPRLRKSKGFTSRILNDPIDILEIANDNDARITLSNSPLKYGIQDHSQKRITFRPANDHQLEMTDEEQNYKAIQSFHNRDRNGRKFSFPKESISSSIAPDNIMIFPSRTGTGKLILKRTSDSNNNYEIVYSADQQTQPHRFPRSNRDSKVKFLSDQNDNYEYNSDYGKYFDLKMRFPRDE